MLEFEVVDFLLVWNHIMTSEYAINLPFNVSDYTDERIQSFNDHNGLYDITREVEAIVTESGIKTGMVNVYAQGATAAIMM